MSQTTRDMTLSLLVVIGVVAGVYFFTASTPAETIRVVDYVPTAQAARSSGAFDVSVPVGLTPAWRATSVRYTPSAADPKVATWHLGFLTPADQYVAVEQTNGADPGFVREATAQGRRDGGQPATAGSSITWMRYYSESKNHRSLVSKSGDTTTVVTGTLSYDELAAFAASLSTT